ncbi:Protein FAM76B [Myotis davidii]|uniref:Protein FAM76B n=1 Tax=Myotis davidii TaxID=225400 RepID=L5LN34_MYODS|nr:Protein FAM76B [Myotis davidii]
MHEICARGSAPTTVAAASALAPARHGSSLSPCSPGFVQKAKNRELLKQVAALSKGKKFDKSGSILTSP